MPKCNPIGVLRVRSPVRGGTHPSSFGVEVGGLKNVDDGSAVAVPPGCSYSPVSKMAIFNVNPAGRSSDVYQCVCRHTELSALLQPTSADTAVS